MIKAKLVFQGKGGHFLTINGVGLNLPVLSPPGGKKKRKVHRHREHKAFVIIGMFPNEIDPPGGADNHRGGARPENLREDSEQTLDLSLDLFHPLPSLSPVHPVRPGVPHRPLPVTKSLFTLTFSLAICNFLLLPGNLGFFVSFLKNLHHMVGIFKPVPKLF